MPSYVHQNLLNLVQSSMKRLFDKFRVLGIAELALYTNGILSCGSTTLRLVTGSKHTPNLQFATKQSRFPILIVEILIHSLSMGMGNLSHDWQRTFLALQSSGNVNMVIDLTFKYDSHQEHPPTLKENKSW